MNYDLIQAIFWSITYFLIIIEGFVYKKEYKKSIPLLAVAGNFSWEIIALICCFNAIHLIWLSLDLVIVFLSLRILKHYERYDLMAIFLTMIISFAIAFYFLFETEYGQLITSFCVDIHMAALWLIAFKNISPHFKLPIAITKLMGDFYAWLFYRNMHDAIYLIGILVLIINSIYLIMCANEFFSRITSSKR